MMYFVGTSSTILARTLARRSPVASSSRLGLRFESNAASPIKSTHYRITLRRSGIGMPAKTNRILESLGLKKRLQSVYRPIGPEAAGAILAVKELVHVDNVRRLSADNELGTDMVSDEEAVWVNEADEVVDAGKSSRKAPRGYKVVGNLIDAERDEMIRKGTL
ncbi:hypothetical protein IE53DRAFT_275630 [Violaceomyces palustris]|uniref:Uncharacterized protein n=1 Tax=Violaceomyces palustris TaxID=1673888 RepID=A0ACD0P842_9BASI|nr:hypothetical protein IE53DRAFT_275630 [Violaceomyces palustris]